MPTRKPIAIGEWYHCFNRGVDKRKVFESASDYQRFLILLYICNSKEKIHASDFNTQAFKDIFLNSNLSLNRKNQLVEVGAFLLMQNHFHILLREKQAGGIALFMQKVFTGYTMFFNKKYERSGPLFAGSFKAKHVDDDIYLRHLLSYIHLNPAEIADGMWKKGKANKTKIFNYLCSYPYSSLSFFVSRLNLDTKKQFTQANDYTLASEKIVSEVIFDYLDEVSSVQEMIDDAHEYYEEHNVKV